MKYFLIEKSKQASKQASKDKPQNREGGTECIGVSKKSKAYFPKTCA